MDLAISDVTYSGNCESENDWTLKLELGLK